MILLSYLKKYISRQLPDVIKFLFLTLLVIAVSTLSPYFVGKFIDTLLSANKKDMYGYIAVLGIVWTIELTVSYLRNISNAKLNVKIMYNINLELIEHVKRIPLPFFSKNDSAYLNQRMHTDSNMLTSFFLNGFIGLIIQIAYFVFALGILIYTNINIAIMLLVFVPLYVLFYLLLKKPIHKLNYENLEIRNIFFSKMNEQLYNVKVVKLNSWYKDLSEVLLSKFAKVYESTMKYTQLSYLFSNIDKIIKYLANIAVFLYSGYAIIKGEMTVGQFTMINSYFIMLLGAVSYMFGFGKNYQEALASYDRIVKINKEPEENNGNIIINEVNRISFENVSFGYDSTRRIIDNLSFLLDRGGIYTIIGENGSGKSTLLDILVGLLQDYSGIIRINDNDIKNIDMVELRRKKIAFVEQEPVLFFETVESNINFGGRESGDTDYWIRKLNLQRFISNLSDGLDTKVSEKASNLSGGEKQKIAQLRAFIKDADVLIFDEPNSALDIESINNLCNILQELKINKIIIIISHHQKFIDIADNVLSVSQQNNLMTGTSKTRHN